MPDTGLYQATVCIMLDNASTDYALISDSAVSRTKIISRVPMDLLNAKSVGPRETGTKRAANWTTITRLAKRS